MSGSPWIDAHDPQPITPQQLEQIAGELERLSINHQTDYAAHALRQAGRQLAGQTAPSQPTTGVHLIAAERDRQMAAEGWSPEHDDLHDKGQMAISAARYALEDIGVFPHRAPAARFALKKLWEWESCWWKPKTPIRNLTRAGALIAAEIDRRLRVHPPASAAGPAGARDERGTRTTTEDE